MGVFASFTEDLKCSKDHGNRAKEYCVSDCSGCNGPSRTVRKQIAQCTNDLLVFELPSSDFNISVFDLPKEVKFDNLNFILFAVICKSSNHFVSWIKLQEQWAFYDGMRQPTMTCFKENKTSCDFVKEVKKMYKICSVVYAFRHGTDTPMFGYVDSANNVENVIDLVDVESDSGVDNEDDLLNPGMKEAKKASKALQQKNSNTRNQLGIRLIKLTNCKGKGSKKRAKINVSGVNQKQKKCKRDGSNDSVDNCFSVSSSTEEDGVQESKTLKFDSSKVNTFFLKM